MDLHPLLTYTINNLTFDTEVKGSFAWKMPMRGTFHPFSIFKASVCWSDENLRFYPTQELEKQFNNRELVLRGIQYTADLVCGGKHWQQRLSHEFMGTEKLATKLVQNGSFISNVGLLFEPSDAVDVFEGVTGAAKHMLVMQFVS